MALASVDEVTMRAEIQKLLDGIDLASTSIGKLRASLEQALGLSEGALEARKDHVNRVLQNELMKKFQKPSAQEKKGDDAKNKRKAADKETEETQKKKEKTDEDGKDQIKGDEQKVDEPSAPEPDNSQLVAEPEPQQEPDPTFEEFNAEEEEAAAQHKALLSRVKTWALSGGEDGTLRLWDLEGYACIRVFEGHTSAVMSLSVDWLEMQALSGAADGAKLWSLRLGGCTHTFVGAEDGCAAIVGNWQDSQALGGCWDGRLRLWDLTTGELKQSIQAHAGGVWALDVDWSKKKVASGGDEHFKMWETENWSCIQIIAGHPGGIMCLSVGWEDQHAIIGAGEQSLQLWELEDQQARNLLGHRDSVAHVQVNWAEAKALSGGWDAQLRLWDLEKGILLQAHECKFGRIRSMAADFMQMQAVCGSTGGGLHFVDLHSGATLRSLEGHIGGVTAICTKF